MFEGPPPRREDAAPLSLKDEPQGLRPLDWAELAGRLAAVRDVRAAQADRGSESEEASFDALSARRIAAQWDGEESVNPEASVDRKSSGSTEGEALLARGWASRGNK